MLRAWRSSARLWHHHSSIPWSSSDSSALCAACAMRSPVSVKPRATSLQTFKVCGTCGMSFLRIDMAGLLFSKNLRVGGFCCRRRSGDVQRRVESQCDRRQAKLGAAGLVAELQRDVLLAEE